MHAGVIAHYHQHLATKTVLYPSVWASKTCRGFTACVSLGETLILNRAFARENKTKTTSPAKKINFPAYA